MCMRIQCTVAIAPYRYIQSYIPGWSGASYGNWGGHSTAVRWKYDKTCACRWSYAVEPRAVFWSRKELPFIFARTPTLYVSGRSSLQVDAMWKLQIACCNNSGKFFILSVFIFKGSINSNFVRRCFDSLLRSLFITKSWSAGWVNLYMRRYIRYLFSLQEEKTYRRLIARRISIWQRYVCGWLVYNIPMIYEHIL